MRIFYLWLACFAIFGTTFSWGQSNPSNNYSITIPVVTENEADRNAAFKEALKQVFIQVSNDPHILENKLDILSAFDKVDNYIESFTYNKNAADQTHPYNLIVSFEKPAIDQLLNVTPADEPVDENDPVVITWVVIDKPDHPGDILDSSGTEVQTTWEKIATQNHLQLLFPMMDMADMNLVSAPDVAALKPATIQKASERYDSDGILLGHIKDDGAVKQSQWIYLDDSKQYQWNFSGDTINVLFGKVAAQIAALSDEHDKDTVKPKDVVLKEAVSIDVANVQNQNDLINLMQSLQHLSSVADVALASINGDHVILEVTLQRGKDNFAKALAGIKSLVKTPAATDENPFLFSWKNP